MPTSTGGGGGATIGGGTGTAPPPTVTSVTPNSGPSSGGTAITISGSNFDSGATVLVGGKAPAQATVTNSGTIQAVTPPHAAGPAEVQVRNSDGQRGILLNSFTFVAVPPPFITFVSPSSGPSSGGTKITVNGRDFLQGAQIFVGGAPATSVNFVNSNQLEGVTPPGPAGSAPVEVRNPDGQLFTLAAGFDYTLGPAPTLTAITPTFGPAAGGTTVNLTGSNFLPGAAVLFGGVASTSVTVVSSTQIQAVTPSRSPGVVDVTVRNPDNQSATLVQRFSFLAPPTVTSTAPASGPLAGGTTVTIIGSGFQNGTTARFGGVPATSVTVVSTTQLRVVTPAGSVPGAVDVTALNPDGQTATLAGGFSYTVGPPPSLTSIAPVSGPTAGGTTVVLTGSNFQSGATVSFDTTLATSVTFVSATQVQAVAPARTAGTVDVRITNPDSQSSTLAGAFTFLAPPVVTAVSPNFGPTAGGTSVTITGSAFQVGATVTFGGTAGTNVMVLNSSQITANTPARSAGAVTVRVTNPDTQFGELANVYTFFNPPTVTSISPTSWPVSGGTTVTITGTNFQAGANVLFGGVAATSVIFDSATQLRAVTPAGTAGATSVQVVNPDGQSASAPGGGTYVLPPTITDATPNSGPAAGGTTVTITGTDFQMGATVRFGATAGTSVVFTSPTQLQAVTPAGTGSVNITVTNPDGQSATLANGFVYAGAPVVQNVMPNSGPAIGGTAVTINGGNFQPGATVTFGGTAATSVVVVNSTQITCTTPARAAGAVTVQVTNPDAQSGPLANGFTFVAAPTVASVMPNTGPVAGGTSVTITGTGFATSGTVTVLFGGSPATSVVVSSPTQLTAVTPANVAGAVNVQVHNPDNQVGTLMNGFTYVAPPTVTSASPNRGPVAGGTVVVITGSDFQSGATVRFGATLATSVMFNSATQLTATTPAGAAGTANIVVTNPDNQSGTLPGGFVYELGPAPQVNGISPTSGPTAGGTMVMISGANFVMGAQVRIGGTLASGTTFVNSTQINATTPAGTAGDADVQVTNPDGQSGTLPAAFTYVPPPAVSNVMPGNGPVVGGTAVTINGSNFQPGATVTIGGASATSVNFVSAAQLTAITPAGSAGPATVQVTNPDGQVGMLAAGFTYDAPPDLVSINPTNGPTSGGTQVTLMGSEFRPGIAVFFGNSLGSGLIFDSSNQVRVNTPPLASGTVDVVVRNPDGQQDVLANAFTYDLTPGPTVSSVNPMSGPTAGGTVVTIMGSSFVNGATVWFGGNQGLNVVFSSSTEVQATTPAAMAGTVDVSVQNPNLQTGTLANAFTFLAPPVISSVSPNSGPAAGGTTVAITGTGFQNTPTPPTVLFGGTPAASVVFNSPTQLTVTTAAGAGSVSVQVTNADGQSATQPNAFTFVPAPTISDSTPGSGPTAGGTLVTINGTGFQSGATVFFGAAPAASVTFVNATRVRATSPASAAGTVDITVRNPDMQQAVRANAFTFIPPPNITSVMPGSGPVTGGTTVTIAGSDFRNTPTLPTVLFAGTAATSVIFDSAMQLRAVTPMHAAGLVDVQVRNPDNQTVTAMNAFTFVPPPTVLAVMPTSGPVSGNTQITITGTDFVNGATVRVGGNLATGVIFDSSSQLRANTPAGAEGSASVQVTNPDGQSSTLASAFVYVAPPAITNVSPASGPLAGGTTLTITGSKFQANATVLVGGNAATMVVVNSSTQIQAVTPAGVAAATVDVRVTNPDGQFATRANSFTYVAPPMVNSLMPTSGPTAGGTSVVITGSAFQMGATVSFGGTAAPSVTFNSASQLTATAPARSAGLVTVTVTNPDGQSGSLPNSYTYFAPPTVSSVNPNSGPTAGGTAVTIGGMNFRAGATVTIGGTAATMVVVNSSTSISAVTPMRASGGAVNVTVTNTDGQSGTLTSGFTYVPPPGITGISPNSGPTAGGTSTTITGSNFLSGATVLFGGTAAASVTVVSPTQIQATTPSRAAGTIDVQVRNPDNQTGTLFNGFTFLAPPTINTIMPSSGFAMGGTSVTIGGANFQPGATVTFGGTAATVTSNSPTQLVVLTPARTPGAVNVVVRNPDGQSATAVNGFTYVANPAPTISSVNPTFGPASGLSPVDGSVITITVFGSNFLAGASVLFSGTAGIVNGVSPTQIGVVTPPHPPGTVNVEVRNPDGQSAILTNGYTFTAPPTVTGVTPNSGPTTGGTTVSIAGTGFLAGAVVLFGGVAAPVATVQSPTQIQATTPAAQSAGSVNVRVVNPDEQSGTLSGGFSYTVTAPAPTVSAISPDSGPDTGGTSVIITGTNFQSGATVLLGGTLATVMSVSSTQIQANTPPHVEGPVNVDVRNPDAQMGRLSSGYTYTLTTIPGLVVPAASELPRAQVDVSMPDTTGYVSRSVCASGCNFTSIQAAVDDAANNCGSTGRIVNIRAGETFNLTSPVFLRPHNCASDKWVIIQSDSVASLPALGTRATPANAAQMPKIQSTLNNVSIFRTPSGTFVTRYRLIGLFITHTAPMGELMQLGDGGPNQNTLAKVPTKLIVDRCLIRGSDNPPLNSTRGVSVQCGDCAVIESHIDQIHGVGFDTQAIGGWNGTGPVLIRNNFLSGAAENILIGGASTAIPNNNPHDITIVRNYIFKPLSWYVNDPSFAGTRWSVKNLLELKTGVRVLIEGNVMENCFPDAQVCTALNIKSSNSNSGGLDNPWALTSDVTIRYNRIINAMGGTVQMQGWNGIFQSQLLARVYVHDNLFEKQAAATFGGNNGGNYLVAGSSAPLGGPIAMRFEHNTVAVIPPDPGQSFAWDVTVDSPMTYFPGGFSIHDNIFATSGTATNPRQAKMSCRLTGTSPQPWDCFDVPSGTPNGENSWFRNLVYHTSPQSTFCTPNRPLSTGSPWAKNAVACVNTLADVGFVDAAGGNFRLAPGTRGKNAATDGRDVGANIDLVEQMTAGVKP